MNKRIYLVASLALLTGTVHASQYNGLIAAGGLRFSTGTGASTARVSVAVSQATACGLTWYAYENAASGLGGLWTAALIQARIHGRTVSIVGTGTCDSFQVEGIRWIDLK